MTSSLPLSAEIASLLSTPPLPLLRIPSTFNAVYRNKWARSTSRPDLTILAWYVWSLRLSLRPWLTCWPHLVIPSVRPLTTVSTRGTHSTGTVSISPQDCPIDDKVWSDCHTDLLNLLSEYDAVNIRCYTLFPRDCQKDPINVARISYKRHELSTHVYIAGIMLPVRPYVPPPCQCRNCWRFGHPEKHCLSAALCVALPKPAINALLLPSCAAIVVALIMLSTAAAQHISLRLRSLVFAFVTVSHYVRHIRKPVA